MKKIIIITIFWSLLFTTNVFSQLQNHFSVQYDISFGTGDLGDYISAASFRGASFQYRYAVSDNIMVGGDVAWNVFYEKKDFDSYTIDSRTLSGIQYLTQNEIPILFSADYLILTNKKVKPYIGLGIGTIYTERSTDMGTWRLMQDPWQFAMKPEVGMLYDISYSTSLKVALKYYNAFKTGDIDNQGYFSLSIGLAFGK